MAEVVPEIRSGGDAGLPLVADQPKGEAAAAFHAIAVELLARLAKKAAIAQPPVV